MDLEDVAEYLDSGCRNVGFFFFCLLLARKPSLMTPTPGPSSSSVEKFPHVSTYSFPAKCPPVLGAI